MFLRNWLTVAETTISPKWLLGKGSELLISNYFLLRFCDLTKTDIGMEINNFPAASNRTPTTITASLDEPSI
jgi:hypothetical protein